MHKSQQATIVSQLLDSLRTDILEAIREGRVPEEWDGIELRQYIADKALENIVCCAMPRKRLKDYRNALVVRNL